MTSHAAAPTQFGRGQPVRRVEDDRFLRGAGQFIDDIPFENAAHAYVLRSPFAHARIDSIDIDAAQKAPGVLAIHLNADVKALGLQDIPNEMLTDGSAAPITMPHLANDVVRYVGEPIALIVAETRMQARDAAEMIELEFEELEAAADPLSALKPNAPQLHPQANGNEAFQWSLGDEKATQAAFDAAAHVVTAEASSQRVVVNSMEPRGVAARYDAALERWTLYCGTQGVHAIRNRVAKNLGVEPTRIQVITNDVGGGFGMKLMNHPEYALVALAAKHLERPVKWIADRSEAFLSDIQGRDLVAQAEGAFTKDGELLAMRYKGVSGIGAYFSQYGAGVHTVFSAAILGGMYRLPVAYAEIRGAFYNATPSDAYRGAGRPETIYVTERIMDAAAQKIGLCAHEIRRRNLLQKSEFPYKTWSGQNFDSGDCQHTFEKALEFADIANFEKRKSEAKKRGAARGFAASYYMERTGGGPVERAKLRLTPEGRIEVWIGTQSSGQGHETAWAQLLHEKLGAPIDAVDVAAGDSDALAAGGGTGGSRSLIMAHRVLFAAADNAIENAKKAAADLLEASPQDIEFSAAPNPDLAREGGFFQIVGSDKTIGLFDVAASEGEILGEGGVDDRSSTFPNGAHVAEVEVDLETGRAQLKGYTVVDDFGVVLNPLLVTGQVHGGVAQGVGQALMEQAVFEPETAQPQAGSFMDYAMPRAADFPMLKTTLSETAPCASNPMGVKGCGEAGSVGATPAVTLAVLDALRPYGVKDLQTPLTPVKIWTALNGT